jgi:hypothetical protein
MNVVPIKSAELGRWRLAISEAVPRLSFLVDHRPAGPKLVAQLRGQEGRGPIECEVARALIELHEQLSSSVTDDRSGANDVMIVAVVFRERLLNLMIPDAEPLRSGRTMMESMRAPHTYADALGALLKTILESDGPAAVRALAQTGSPRAEGL